jgi:hypothetical protein
MKKIFMLIPSMVLFSSFALISCKTASDINTNLPKDISERPADEGSQKYDEAALDKLKLVIEEEIGKEKCTDPAEWTYAPMGSKSCGGPQFYIAYPKKLEAKILPKIKEYTSREEAFNKKYNIQSNCTVMGQPAGIRCNGDKAELAVPVE